MCTNILPNPPAILATGVPLLPVSLFCLTGPPGVYPKQSPFELMDIPRPHAAVDIYANCWCSVLGSSMGTLGSSSCGRQKRSFGRSDALKIPENQLFFSFFWLCKNLGLYFSSVRE